MTDETFTQLEAIADRLEKSGDDDDLGAAMIIFALLGAIRENRLPILRAAAREFMRSRLDDLNSGRLN